MDIDTLLQKISLELLEETEAKDDSNVYFSDDREGASRKLIFDDPEVAAVLLDQTVSAMPETPFVLATDDLQGSKQTPQKKLPTLGELCLWYTHDAICRPDDAFSADAKDLKKSFNGFTTAVAVYAAAQYGVALGAALSGLCTVLVFATRIGRKVFCSHVGQVLLSKNIEPPPSIEELKKISRS